MLYITVYGYNYSYIYIFKHMHNHVYLYIILLGPCVDVLGTKRVTCKGD